VSRTPLDATAKSSDIAELVSHLYLCEGLSTYRIGTATGLDRQRVGRILAKSGVPVKPRGAGRRRPVDDRQLAINESMEQLYVDSGLSSREVAEITGVPERTVRARLRSACGCGPADDSTGRTG
jgi:DNA-binding transcriptional regulator LsrR (DeoR family)